jgi:tRNA A58 N-methylase Trm61
MYACTIAALRDQVNRCWKHTKSMCVCVLRTLQVFLDLPEPWLAIPHAAAALKPNKSVCCYSPCMEQVQRTIAALQAEGFHR